MLWVAIDKKRPPNALRKARAKSVIYIYIVRPDPPWFAIGTVSRPWVGDESSNGAINPPRNIDQIEPELSGFVAPFRV